MYKKSRSKSPLSQRQPSKSPSRPHFFYSELNQQAIAFLATIDEGLQAQMQEFVEKNTAAFTRTKKISLFEDILTISSFKQYAPKWIQAGQHITSITLRANTADRMVCSLRTIPVLKIREHMRHNVKFSFDDKTKMYKHVQFLQEENGPQRSQKKALTKKANRHELTQEEILKYEKFQLTMQENLIETMKCQEQYLQQLIIRLSKEDSDLDAQIKHYQCQITKQLIERDILVKQSEELHNIKVQEVIEKHWKTIEKNQEEMRELWKKNQAQTEELKALKQESARLDQELQISQSRLNQTQGQIERFLQQIEKVSKRIEMGKATLAQNEIVLKELHNMKISLNNQLQEIKGNIRVYCRIRPAKSQEICVTKTSESTIKFRKGVKNYHSTQIAQFNYLFQQVFDSNNCQQQIFSQLSQLVQTSIDGKNVCIFAYGQTGSGKTYTLLGPENIKNEESQERGISSRSIELIFKQIQACRVFNWQYTVLLSIYEVYLENINDLLTQNPEKVEHLSKLIEVKVDSPHMVIKLVNKAKKQRRISPIEKNQQSSRSHLIITLRLVGSSPFQQRNGSLVLVDLAGSQRLKQSKAEGEVKGETQFINKSLSALGNVINGMRKKQGHIPFRDSKLTFVLQRYLQGDSKALMFANISPDAEDASQTNIFLEFTEKVQNVQEKNDFIQLI